MENNNEVVQPNFLGQVLPEKSEPSVKARRVKKKRHNPDLAPEEMSQDRNPSREEDIRERNDFFYHEHLPKNKMRVDRLRAQGLIPPKPTKKSLQEQIDRAEALKKT